MYVCILTRLATKPDLLHFPPCCSAFQRKQNPSTSPHFAIVDGFGWWRSLMSSIHHPGWDYAQEMVWIGCIRDRNRVCTWFWHTVDIYLSGVWWCSNLLKRNLHSCWGVNSVFCGSQPAGHHPMPSAFVILTRFKTRSTIPLSACAERCGFDSAGCFVSLNALKHPSVFKSHRLSVFRHSCSRDIQMQNVHTSGRETKAAAVFGLNWTKVTESVNSTFWRRIPSTKGPNRGVFTKV